MIAPQEIAASLVAVTDVKLVTFCGSLRSGSVNAATMRAALANLPDGVSVTEVDISDIPFYDGDLEEAGVPASVTALHEAVEAAHGVLIFTPEYNASYPARTKNIIDWLSRPPRSWEGRGLTLVVTTPGGRAGAGVRGHFDGVMGHFNVKHYPALGIGSYGEKLEDGEITDAETIETLKSFIADFAAHCVAADESE